MVGGTKPSRMASSVAATPAAPHAPRGWPMRLFNDEPERDFQMGTWRSFGFTSAGRA
jgi:hypothetical protein